MSLNSKITYLHLNNFVKSPFDKKNLKNKNKNRWQWKREKEERVGLSCIIVVGVECWLVFLVMRVFWNFFKLVLGGVVNGQRFFFFFFFFFFFWFFFCCGREIKKIKWKEKEERKMKRKEKQKKFKLSILRM